MLVLWGFLFICFSLKVRFADDDSQIIKALLKACFLNKKDRLHLGLDIESLEQSRYRFLLGLFTPGREPLPVPAHPPSPRVSGCASLASVCHVLHRLPL